MPKSKDKTKGAKKRRKSPTSAEHNTAESDLCESKPIAKKKKVQKRSGIEGIEKSKLLKEKIKKPRVSQSTTAARNKEPKLCGNGKPMPPLSELERMYEDSDSNDDPAEIKPSTTLDRCVTPETKPNDMIKNEKLMSPVSPVSPNTLKKIASRVLDMISNANVDNGTPAPIIPPKKQNKSGIPFIVGCKDREQVPWAPKSSFCKGSPKYGVEPQAEEECKGENIGPHYANISKSIFNAQSDEISVRLKELEQLESLEVKPAPTSQTTARSGSPDSNKTVPYDFPDSPKSPPRSFSPLPSTSKDCETMLKNDKLFNKSLNCESVPSNSSQEDIEIVEVPCETIIIDDTVPDRKPEPMDVDIDPVDLDDDCCVIVESESNLKPKPVSNNPVEIKDELYSSLDLTQGYDYNEVCEVIDVDDVISENRALLNKYRRESNLESVIFVEPNAANQESTNNNPFRNPRQSYTNGPVLATVENASSRPSVMSSMQGNGNDIRDVVTSFFRHTGGNDRRPSLGGDDYETSTATNVNRSDAPSPGSDTNSTIGRILSWLTSIPCRTGHSKTNRNRSESRINRELPQSGRLSSEANETRFEPRVRTGVEIIVEPRPRTSAEVTDILTQALASANQQHALLQQQFEQEQQEALLQSSLEQQRMDNNNSPKGLGDCPICMDNLSDNAIASTLCGHIFCMKCIKTAIRANGKRCPTCRKGLKGVGYHQLFL